MSKTTKRTMRGPFEVHTVREYDTLADPPEVNADNYAGCTLEEIEDQDDYRVVRIDQTSTEVKYV